MHKTISLSQYVKRRTGVPLGGSGSMRNMLERSLGAGSFNLFWYYWNPIWSYYLSRNVMRPLSRLLPFWLATITTFAISGGLHDLAVTLVKWRITFFFTPWFFIMGLLVVVSKSINIEYRAYSWPVRVLCNLAFIALSLWITQNLLAL
ncbi:acyltransferase [Paraglaciecola sp. 25GB23A]|uniref:acyltransferase n=1 Tax=Paraglaciecola sp. 25GB23A TaxID=3156068 RepID=UPI0032AFFFEA